MCIKKGIILKQEKLAKNIYSMWIFEKKIATKSKSGQFIFVYINNLVNILPRPISICEINKKIGNIRIVYKIIGNGTNKIKQIYFNNIIYISGPYGNSFPINRFRNKNILVIGGGIGISPMLQVVKDNSNNIITVILGYKDSNIFLNNEFINISNNVFIVTEDGSVGIKGNIFDVIYDYNINSDIIFACGPIYMLRLIKHYYRIKKNICYISIEKEMLCGIGVCLSCVCKINNKYICNNNKKKVCKDGPIFLSTEIEL